MYSFKVGTQDFGTISCIFDLPMSPQTISSRKKHLSLILGLTLGSVAFLVLSLILGFYFWREKRWKSRNSNDPNPQFDEMGTRPNVRPNTGLSWFMFQELRNATDDFLEMNFIGKGRFGIVYKGTLPNGNVVAVKKAVDSNFQGNKEFCNEVEIISNLKHRNLVPLRGCCIAEDEQDFVVGNGHRYLVYDFMCNGNLNDLLFLDFKDGMRKQPLQWPQRTGIILDVAKGIQYLHYGVKPGIYHRDIKPNNILLDSEMRARVADFGLANQFWRQSKCRRETLRFLRFKTGHLLSCTLLSLILLWGMAIECK